MTEVSLGEVVDILTGYPFKSALYSADETGTKLIRGDNIVQGAFRWDNVARWRAETDEGFHNYELAEGDIVLAMDRPWIDAGLKYARVVKGDLPALLVQRVARLRARSGLDQRYLYYVIGGPAFTDHVLSVQTGTAVPHISSTQIQSFKFRQPPLGEQAAIAGVLGALDDKIQQNEKTALVLGRLAHAIFQAWFVDFKPVKAKGAGATEFPDMPQALFDNLPSTFIDSTLGPIPAGWQIKSLNELADFLNGLPLQTFPPRHDGSDLPVIKIAQLRKGSAAGAALANDTIDEKYKVLDGDLLFSWSGTLEVEFWFGGPGALNQHLFKVTSAEFPLWLVAEWLRLHLPAFRAIAASKATTMGHIKRSHLGQASVAVPPEWFVEQSGSILRPVFDAQAALRLESRKLTELRDYLLPRLISGSVEVLSHG